MVGIQALMAQDLFALLNNDPVYANIQVKIDGATFSHSSLNTNDTILSKCIILIRQIYSITTGGGVVLRDLRGPVPGPVERTQQAECTRGWTG